MELSSEDALRLNVLIANAEAVRIDENAMAVYGLRGEQEMKIQLNPNCQGEKYLHRVREALSSAVLDSPGGYPVFLRRWTRMGQIDHDQMDRLLRLGESEAIMAVVCSPGLTEELARRAWWAAPTAENGRRMLENPKVVNGRMGPILADYLVEYLPFETEHCDILETVRLVLQPGLLADERRQRLWDSGRTKKTYRVGFLHTVPDALPEVQEARHNLTEYAATLQGMAGNRFADLLRKLLDASGQSFLEVAADALRRPADQDVVSALLNAIGNYCRDGRLWAGEVRDLEALQGRLESVVAEDEELAALAAAMPALLREIHSMVFLAHIDEAAVTPIFARSDAIGSVMRTRIEPVTARIFRHIAVLRGQG